MKKELKQYKWMIIFGFSIFFFAATIIFFVVPTLIDIKNKKEQTDILSKKNEVLFSKITQLDSFSMSDLEEKYQLVNIGLLQNKDPYKIFSLFDNVLTKVDPKNITLGKFGFQAGEIKDEKTAAKLTDLVFSQDIEGKMENVSEFVKTIEEGFPLMTVKTLSGQMGENLNVKFDFLLHVYPETTQIPSLETPITGFSAGDSKVFDGISPYLTIYEKSGSTSPQKSGKVDPFTP